MLPRRLLLLPLPLGAAVAVFGLEVVGLFVDVAVHSPWCLMLTFEALPVLQFAKRRRHVFVYVLPFEPHTGA